jgi:hypothetical protein
MSDIMKKTPEQTFEEMMLRNHRSQTHQAAFTFWRDSNYEKTDHYDRFKKFGRWFDPNWTLPAHAQPIVDLFAKNFVSHKVIVTDVGEGVLTHLNPSRSDDKRNWKQWHTWSYTMCVPFSMDVEFEPVVMVYDRYLDDVEAINHNPCWNLDISKCKAVVFQPFTRISFASSRFAHGVCSSNNKLLWILNDMWYDTEPPHIQPDVKTITSLDELDADMKRVIGLRNSSGEPALQHQFMSDLDYFLSFDKPVTELDWIPPNL